MERIQEAVEKARAERQGVIGQTPNLDVDKNSTGNSTSLSPRAGIFESRQDVIYTKTRSEDLDINALRQKRVIATPDFDKTAEVYRQLRTQILKELQENQWNSLAITSAHEGAGKTLTAINLAIAISREVNHTVMLVDLDLRNPSIKKTLCLNVEKGLIDYLEGHSELENILVNPGFPRMVVLPGSDAGNYSSEILSSPQMQNLVTEIKSRYKDRIIIFDLPPLLRNDDALIFIPFVDTTLFIVEEGVTTEQDLVRSLQLMENRNLIGTVLNKARSK